MIVHAGYILEDISYKKTGFFNSADCKIKLDNLKKSFVLHSK